MKNVIIICVVFTCILSCKKDSCKEEPIIAKHFEAEYGCVNTKHGLNIDLVNNFTVIRSTDAYDSQVSGTCHPEIDFSSYDLIIGKQSSAYLNDTITYDYKRACPDMELTLSVDIIQSSQIQPDTVVYHALVPKIGDQETLNLMITVR